MPASVPMPNVGVNSPFIDDSAPDDDAEFTVSSGDAKGAQSSVVHSAPGTTFGRSDTLAVVRQITDMLPRLSDRAVEIRLSPEELGTVRLQLVQSDQGLVVHVHAERPETLDLLRRHIDQLARHLEASGQEASGFTFSDGQGQTSGNNHTDQSAGIATPETGEALPDAPVVAGSADGIDIRV